MKIRNDITAILDLTRTISPTLVADFKGSFSRWAEPTTVGTAIAQGYSVPGLTMPFVPTAIKQNIAPEIAVTNYTSIFGNTSVGSVNNYWYFSPSLAQVKGRHTLHYGFELLDYECGAYGMAGEPNGTFTFNAGWTQENPLAATTGTGNGLASLLLGYPTSGSVAWDINNFIVYHHYGLYIQDDYKALKNLTLNLGLRWDVDTAPSERHNGINGGFCFTCTNPYSAQVNPANYPGLENPLTGGFTFAGVTASRTPGYTDLNNWQPRFGIAWAITPKTVFRGGIGMFYNYGNSVNTNTGFDETTSYVESLNGNVNPTNYFLSGTPFPSGVIAPLGAKGGYETDAGNGISYYSPSGIGRVPRTLHWSAGFQRALPERVLLDVDYVGSRTSSMTVDQPWDTIGLTGGANQVACFHENSICNDPVPNPFYGVLPVATTLGASKTLDAWQLTVPYPLFNGITEDNDPLSYFNYNALQVRVERRMKSIDFVFNYTYSTLFARDAYLNSGDFVDPSLWYGLDSIDVRHFIDANAVWPLPIGQGGLLFRNAHGLLGGLLSHWTVVGTPEFWTGEPLEPPSATLTGAPGCTGYSAAAGQTDQHWFNNNESCYHTLADWEARTAPLEIGYIREPTQFSMNAALQKAFALPREGMFLTFRIEASNVLNHPTWGAPNTTVADLPSFTPNVGYTGFGALPNTPNNTARYVILSAKITF